MDDIERRFADQGLIVLAVDAGESGRRSGHTCREIRDHAGSWSMMAAVLPHGLEYMVILTTF